MGGNDPCAETELATALVALVDREPPLLSTASFDLRHLHDAARRAKLDLYSAWSGSALKLEL